jgi:hypothetical protein
VCVCACVRVCVCGVGITTNLNVGIASDSTLLMHAAKWQEVQRPSIDYATDTTVVLLNGKDWQGKPVETSLRPFQKRTVSLQGRTSQAYCAC